jgi:hypothetical protein
MSKTTVVHNKCAMICSASGGSLSRDTAANRCGSGWHCYRASRKVRKFNFPSSRASAGTIAIGSDWHIRPSDLTISTSAPCRVSSNSSPRCSLAYGKSNVAITCLHRRFYWRSARRELEWRPVTDFAVSSLKELCKPRVDIRSPHSHNSFPPQEGMSSDYIRVACCERASEGGAIHNLTNALPTSQESSFRTAVRIVDFPVRRVRLKAADGRKR